MKQYLRDFGKSAAKRNPYTGIHVEYGKKIWKRSENIPLNYVPKYSTQNILLVTEVCINIRNGKFLG